MWRKTPHFLFVDFCAGRNNIFSAALDIISTQSDIAEEWVLKKARKEYLDK
jgi:hypothetical protein